MSIPVLILSLLHFEAGSEAQSNAAARASAANPSLTLAARSQAYEQLIRANSSDPALYAAYADLLIANRDYQKARTWIAKGLAAAPSAPDLLLRQAMNCRSLGDHACARQNLAEAWRLGLRDPYALYSLIEEDHALGDKASGLQHFRAFLEAYPESPWLHVLYANAYAQKDADAEARAEYREALRLKPDLPAVNFRLGYLLYKDGDYAAAVEYFRKELALNPAYSDAHLFLGQSLRNLGKDDEAIVCLRQAIGFDAGSELAHKALIAALSNKGDLEGAMQSLRLAEKHFPSDPSFPAQLASVLTKLNRESEALKELEKYRALKRAGPPR